MTRGKPALLNAVRAGSIEGLPFILIMVSMIVAVTLALAGYGFREYMRRLAEEQIVQQVRIISGTASDLFMGGEGGARTVEIELPSALMNMSLGADPEAGIGAASVITWALVNGPIHRHTVLAQGRSVPLNGTEEFHGGTVSLTPGVYTLTLCKMRSDMDLNGDGDKNDHYIQIRFG